MGLCDLDAMEVYNSRESRVTVARDIAEDKGVKVDVDVPARII